MTPTFPSRRAWRWGALGLVFAVAICATYFVSLRSGLALLEVQARRHASTAQDELFVPIEKYRYLPTVLATHSIVQAVLRRPEKAEQVHAANIYLQQLNKAAGSAELYLLDVHGNTLASSNWNAKDSFVGHNFSYRPYFQKAIRGEEGEFYGLGAVSRSPGYYVSRPVMIDRRIAGVIVVKIQLTNLDREWYGKPGYFVAVADEYGILFLSSQPNWKYRPLKPLRPDEIKLLGTTHQYDRVLRRPLWLTEQPEFGSAVRVVKLASGDAEGDSLDPSGYVLQERKLPDSPWSLLVFMDVSPVHESALQNAAAAGVLMLFLLVCALYWNEFRKRVAERDASRLAIEAAHAELAQRHRQLELLTEELRLKAVTDPLGCYNRRFFLEQAGKLVAGATRYHFPLSIVILDIDYFKSINDRYGHPIGDMVLLRLVDICQAAMRQDDVFARFGGEEFIMALVHTSEREAALATERLRAAIAAERFEHGGTPFSVTVSCGVSQYEEREPDIDATIRRADEALYAAKHGGRNRVVSSHSETFSATD